MSDNISTTLDKKMKDNQSLPSIAEIEAAHKDRPLPVSYKSKRQRYQESFGTSPMTVAKDAIEPVPFNYMILRSALMFMIIKRLEKVSRTFIINETCADRLKQIILSITGDITGRYNVHKGIYLFGPPSSGKTFILESICITLIKAYYTRWYSDIDLPYWYSYKDLMYRARNEKSISFLDTIFKGKKHIFIDDLGYEDDMVLNLYGNKEVVIKHLIDILYKLYTDHDAKIHFTSNVEVSNIRTTYGAATADRLEHMCTPVTWISDINFRTLK
ncbi:MAG TPA: hypothetical protein PKD51_10125 [Saprospiraceae bacterium]|nr:hypothetical protein [Saprospiraceae bacterium]